MVTTRMQYKQQNRNSKIEPNNIIHVSSNPLGIDICHEHTYPIHTPDYNMASRNNRKRRYEPNNNDTTDVISISSTEPEEQPQSVNIVKIKKEPGIDDIEDPPKPNIIKRVIPHMTPYAKYIYRVSGIYIFWILLHYITAHMYVKYCASPSWYGLLVSPFLISSPHCIAMRWVFSKGGTVIEGMWILVGTWLCSKIITQ